MSKTEHTPTPGPWVQFTDNGKCVAIMPAGRDGDICTFDQSPGDADADMMTAAPEMLAALKAALLWTDEEHDVGEWRASARTAISRATGQAGEG